MEPAVQYGFETCKTSINRIKQGPADYESIIGSGEQYTDKSFQRREQLYWPLYQPRVGALYELNLLFSQWDRLSTAFPDATLFGDDPNWSHVM